MRVTNRAIIAAPTDKMPPPSKIYIRQMPLPYDPRTTDRSPR